MVRPLAAALLGILLLARAPESAAQLKVDDRPRHSLYAAFGFGPTDIRPADNEREEEGIAFRFGAEGNDIGTRIAVGYWASDNLGLEIGAENFGTVDVPFTFDDPHDGTSGTGAARVTFRGVSASIVAGYDVVPAIQLTGRLGACYWDRQMSTRFDMPGQPALHRTQNRGGTGLTWGGGVGWQFLRNWWVRAQWERTSFDDDRIDTITVGMEHDFGILLFPRE